MIVASALSHIAADLDAALADLLATFPGFFDPLWVLLFWIPVVWALTLLVAALVRRRRGLPRDLLGAAAVSVLLAVAIGAARRRRPVERRCASSPTSTGRRASHPAP